MANDAFMKPEVPDAFRELMRVSIEQAKRAFDTFAATSEKTWKTFETSSQTASSGLRSLRRDHPQQRRGEFRPCDETRGKQGRRPGHGAPTEHARKQMESFVHQIEEIRDLAAQVIQDSTPPGMPGVGKP